MRTWTHSDQAQVGGMSDGNDRDRPQMAGVVTNDITISSSRRCRYVVRWRNHQCATWNVSRGSDDTSSGSREQSAGSAGSRVVSWKRIQTLIGEATKPLDNRCQPESS